ncbi:winged helix DNA-binding domain-containing protein [Streptomyces sp. CNQ085]|uniref:winged helix DNA-binding domain-containing protein n=1 Tax=Streptomyces sp. CNQ085 TaxID=2886944 RepID=UPI001F50D283|nr:winged helix DNA-binding domain-containing protein [Streptomyces sp. CNQ085]MCI0383430.1 winged helix DNA-binding domain-containing protein [Streptomyces sp. CNQ085]
MTTGTPTVLDRRTLNRALLARQSLLERTTASVSDVLEHLVGMQAQAPNPPYLGLWTRIAGFRLDDLAELVRQRQAVRLVLMRGTIHLVTARDCLALRPVLHTALARGLISAFGRRLNGLDLAEVAAEGRRLVEAEPLTLGELGKRLAERWPDRDAFALANTVRALEPLVQVPPRGLWGESGQAAHTTAETWLGGPLSADDCAREVVRRYLAAFGPATVADMQTWSGMTRLAAVFKDLRPELAVLHDEEGRELFDLPDAPRPGPGAPAPVRLLPEFDNILLSHADRTRILTDEQRRLIITRNGLVKSTFLVDGFVAGTWRIDRKKKTATLVLEPFAPVKAADRKALAEEAESLLATAAADADTRDIRFETP